ncbi:MAG: DUF3224 domain-containing protein [Bacteroidetes bacterium]|jgi:hypothetical protein|nr:DUF3224 domain-containing protein [Bacteroidota bacterium]
MSSVIKTTFKIESWNEEPYSQAKDGPAVFRASVKQSYSGALEAKSTIQYLMTTFTDETSTFIGIEEILGELEGKSGSFLLEHDGTHRDGVAKSEFVIIPNSGSGELSGIRGNGSYEATHETAELTLEYDFEES